LLIVVGAIIYSQVRRSTARDVVEA
jgi:hypothetical protein